MLYLFIRYFWAAVGSICLGGFLWTSYWILEKRQRNISQKNTCDLCRHVTFVTLLVSMPLFLAFAPFLVGVWGLGEIIFFSLADYFLHRMEKSFEPWWKCIDYLGYAILAVMFIDIGVSGYYLHSVSFQFVGIILFVVFGAFLRALYRRNQKILVRGKITGCERLGQICGRIICFVYIFMILFFEIISINTLWSEVTDPTGARSDICLDTGWCKEGYVFDNCPPDGRSCVINKETCEKDGGQWYADRKICNTRP